MIKNIIPFIPIIGFIYQIIYFGNTSSFKLSLLALVIQYLSFIFLLTCILL